MQSNKDVQSLKLIDEKWSESVSTICCFLYIQNVQEILFMVTHYKNGQAFLDIQKYLVL